MKRIMLFWLVLLFPITFFAKEYNSNEINLKFEADDSNYIVLTRDNLDSLDLEKINVTKDRMETIMDSQHIYFDIVKNDLSYEILIVVPNKTLSFSNLSKATSSELSNLKEAIIKETGDKVPTIYKNDYSYIMVDYQDNQGYSNINYYTVINYHGYNIQLQKKGEIINDDERELREIIDSIEFNEIEDINDDDTNVNEEKSDNSNEIIMYSIVIGGIAGLITYFISNNYINKRKKRK